MQEVVEGEKGGIGEVACDLTMMASGCIKLDAKHGSNQGIDGLYEKDGSLIAAEVKYHKTPPRLESIMRDNLMPKFDLKYKGALVKINRDLCQKIRKINYQEKLYFLPYGIHPNGQAYCYFKQDTFSDPNMEKLMKEISSFSTLENIGPPSISSIPGPREKEKYERVKKFHMTSSNGGLKRLEKTHKGKSDIRPKTPHVPAEPPIEGTLFSSENTGEEIIPLPSAPLLQNNGALVYPTTTNLKEYQNLFLILQGNMNCEMFHSQMAQCLGGPVKKTHILNIRQGNSKVTDTMLQGVHTQFLNLEIREKVEKLFLKSHGQ